MTSWFDENRRPLPWRRSAKGSGGQRNAWHALVAEAMLQQTQIARVVQRFEVFIQRFPTPAALAQADEEEVLTLWQGLGYYRRARHLLDAARIVMKRFHGRVPAEVADLLELPGVGRYSAGAIASIVFGRAVPIVDGNVHRVLARLESRATAADDRAGMEWTWQRARELVEAADAPGKLNEAMMELGSTVCLPRNPICSACPLTRHCKARRKKLQHAIPPAKKPPVRRTVYHHAVVIRKKRSGEVLLEQRPESGLWAGMWQVPTIESDGKLPSQLIAASLGLAVGPLKMAGQFEHQTSHRRVKFHVLLATPRRAPKRHGVWRSPADIADLPMSNAQKRILQTYA